MGVSTLVLVLVAVWRCRHSSREDRRAERAAAYAVGGRRPRARPAGPAGAPAIPPATGRDRGVPQCGKPLGVRAVACQFCQYRFPAVDVMITRAPADADSRRGLLSEMAREYGIPYADAARLLEQLPVAGYRHVLPDQVSEYVRRLEAVGATVAVVPTPLRRARGAGPSNRPLSGRRETVRLAPSIAETARVSGRIPGLGDDERERSPGTVRVPTRASVRKT